MADLDDEFARFEAEIQSLEQQPETSEDKKTAKTEDETQPPVKKVKTLSEGLAAPPKPVVVMAKPKIYMAPPPEDRPRMLNTLEDVAAYRGALSGFPVGTTGERAATLGSRAANSAPAYAQPRLDMETGQVLPLEEQAMMNRQQSVYEYDPKRTAASAAGAKDGAPSSYAGGAGGKMPKRHLRLAGGSVWEDPTLEDWPDNDFRLFCGDLGNEVSDELLAHSFGNYATFQRARVVRDKLTHKSRGYGFVSFTDPFDCAKALREMNGKYIGNRPVKLSKSKWQDRNIDVAKKKMRKRKRDKHHLFN
ncbi:hypothetical protein BBP00_00003181 [Phytophthora kernoviae]|uniref:RRM domain-containing protein n=1 Tax=Phytophthora kernoviae TaxID=325452 RepID=A0A3F2RV78_9STRA|nr:hypothetical protein BBP00_00003181 [Phytophthora kernoviae]